MKCVTELAIGREVRSRGTLCGTVTFVVWDPERGKVTYLVVQPDGPVPARLVPIGRAVPCGEAIEFGGTPAEFRLLREAASGLFARDGQAGWPERSDHVLVWDPAGDLPGEVGSVARARSLQAA